MTNPSVGKVRLKDLFIPFACKIPGSARDIVISCDACNLLRCAPDAYVVLCQMSGDLRPEDIKTSTKAVIIFAVFIIFVFIMILIIDLTIYRWFNYSFF